MDFGLATPPDTDIRAYLLAQKKNRTPEY